MTFPFVATKTFLPVPPRTWIHRSRLILKLVQGLEPGRKLILVSAPPGYGKTTLVSAWCLELLAGSAPEINKLSWLSLENNDNDIIRFLVYLVHAFQKAFPGTGEWLLAALQSPQPPSFETVLADLINELSTHAERWILVLDDYHTIKVEQIHDAVAFLLEHIPEQGRLILLSRTDPPLALARLRARQQLVEVRAEDLRFTMDETQTFFNQVMGLSLSPEDIASLDERIEGWAAGLQLAALSVQGRADASAFIQEFSVSDFFILDFLAEEVLDRLDETTKQFLLQTCVLGRMCGSLVNAVTGRSDGHAMLERLSKANLFIISLDNSHQWYRYHHLFADLLLSRLQFLASDQIPNLYHRASEWCAQHQLIDEAIEYALSAGDDEQAARLIMDYAPVMTNQGRITGLTTWIGRLPEELITRYPSLGILFVWADYFEYKFDQAEAWLKKIEATISTENRDKFAGELALWKGIFVRVHGEIATSIEWFQKAVTLLPSEDTPSLGRAYLFLGLAYTGVDYYRAQEALERALLAYMTGDFIHGKVVTLRFLTWVLIMRGSLDKASAICQQAVLLAESVPKWPTGSYAYTAFGMVLYERNELTRAAMYMEKGVELARVSGNKDTLSDAAFRLARVYRALGQWEKAQQMLDLSREVPQSAKHFMQAQIEEEQIFLWLVQHHLGAVHQIVDISQPPQDPVTIYPAIMTQIAWARVSISCHRPQQAIDLLVHIQPRTANNGMRRLYLQILLLQALAWKDRNQMDPAYALLAQVLSLASADGYIRLFLDEGEMMRDLLVGYRSKLEAGASLVPYIDRLIAGFPAPAPTPAATPPLEQPSLLEPAVQRANTLLVEPLSAREIEVLRLIAAGCSNKEIASQLVIAVSTVKQHMNHILGKLEATNRTQAVAKARAMGLLQS